MTDLRYDEVHEIKRRMDEASEVKFRETAAVIRKRFKAFKDIESLCDYTDFQQFRHRSGENGSSVILRIRTNTVYWNTVIQESVYPEGGNIFEARGLGNR